MDASDVNSWAGKSAEDVLVESYHKIRDPIYSAVGYLNVLNSADQLSLSAEQVKQYVEAALHNVLRAKNIVDPVYQSINEPKRDQ